MIIFSISTLAHLIFKKKTKTKNSFKAVIMLFLFLVLLNPDYSGKSPCVFEIYPCVVARIMASWSFLYSNTQDLFLSQ